MLKQKTPDTVVARFRFIREKYVKYIGDELSLSAQQKEVLSEILNRYTGEMMRDCIAPHIDGTLSLGVEMNDSKESVWGK